MSTVVWVERNPLLSEQWQCRGVLRVGGWRQQGALVEHY
jgi:hypothetical protein